MDELQTERALLEFLIGQAVEAARLGDEAGTSEARCAHGNRAFVALWDAALAAQRIAALVSRQALSLAQAIAQQRAEAVTRRHLERHRAELQELQELKERHDVADLVRAAAAARSDAPLPLDSATLPLDPATLPLDPARMTPGVHHVQEAAHCPPLRAMPK